MKSLYDRFALLPDEAYLNGASRSPQLHAGADAARRALAWRETNTGMPIEEFFTPVARLRESFAQLINGTADRVALLPAASYGLATVARNLPLSAGQHLLVVQDQFPSNYYAWERRCREAGAELRTVARPTDGARWSDRVLEGITSDTAAVAIAHVHWADGSIFDLEALRRRTEDVGAWLIVDGTQSVGTFPFDVRSIRPDALVCAGYKWLLGPYGCGYAYYGERMDDGVPLEENWINRAGSDDFARLADYRAEYRPLAARYCVGEHSNFLAMPMQQAGLDLLNAVGPAALQQHVTGLWQGVSDALESLDLRPAPHTARHLLGLRLPDPATLLAVKDSLDRHRVRVSYRGDLVRVSPAGYNRPEDMERLVEGLRAALVR